MAVNNKFGVTAWMDDKLSGPMKELGKGAQKMGEGFSKSAATLRLVENAAGDMGGEIANVAGKVSGLAGIIGSGGPFGLALAAMTIAVAAGAKVYQDLTNESRLAARGTEFAAQRFLEAGKALDEHRRKVEELRREVANFGKTQEQVSKDGIRQEIERREFGAKILAAEIDKRKEGIVAMQAETATLSVMEGGEIASGEAGVRRIHQLNERVAEEGGLIRIQEACLPINAQRLGQLREELKLTGQLDNKKKAKKETKEEEDVKKNAEERAGIIIAMEERIERARQQIDKTNLDRKIDIDHKETEILKKREDDLIRADEDQEKTERHLANIAQELSQAVTDVALANSGEAKDAAIDAAISTALGIIAAEAAAGAAKAIEAHAGIPFVGPIVGALAAGVITAMILAFRSKVVGAATGGLISGGTPGRDRVPAMLMPGELVMPVPVAQAFQRMANGGNSGSGGGSGGNVNGSINMQALDPSSVSDSQMRRIARKLGNEIEVMRGRGMVRRGAA